MTKCWIIGEKSFDRLTDAVADAKSYMVNYAERNIGGDRRNIPKDAHVNIIRDAENPANEVTVVMQHNGPKVSHVSHILKKDNDHFYEPYKKVRTTSRHRHWRSSTYSITSTGLTLRTEPWGNGVPLSRRGYGLKTVRAFTRLLEPASGNEEEAIKANKDGIFPYLKVSMSAYPDGVSTMAHHGVRWFPSQRVERPTIDGAIRTVYIKNPLAHVLSEDEETGLKAYIALYVFGDQDVECNVLPLPSDHTGMVNIMRAGVSIVTSSQLDELTAFCAGSGFNLYVDIEPFLKGTSLVDAPLEDHLYMANEEEFTLYRCSQS